MQIVQQLLKSSTAKDSIILFLGTVVSTGCGFLLTILLTRSLTAAEFGLFITALTFSQLVSDLFELGLNSAILNLYPGSNPENRKEILITSFMIRCIISFIVSFSIFIFASDIGAMFFKNEAITDLIKYSSFGILFFMITTWGQTIFQARGKFFSSMLVVTMINVSRVCVLSILLLLGFLNLNNAFFWTQFILIIPFLLVFILIKPGWLIGVFNQQKAKQLIYYGLPVGISFSIAAVYSKLDQLLIFNIAGDTEAGIYGGAFRIAAIFIAVSAAFGSAITPRFSSMALSDYTAYFKNTIKVSVGLAILVVLSLPVISFLIPITFGDDFIRSVVPFQILGIGIACFILYSPFYNGIVYHFKKPQFTLTLSVVSLILTWVLLQLWIPQYKSVGGAVAVTTVYFLQMIVCVAYYLYLEKRR